uniref:tryptophan synthase n=1 Tax=Oryza punctata TaxID=4537 RepID=A0A0E0KK69_ORYPU
MKAPPPSASSSSAPVLCRCAAAPATTARVAARRLAAPSSAVALEAPVAGGATLEAILSMLKEVTPELSCPVVLLSYFGPILRRGAANFTAAAKEAGVQGLIVPDLPFVDTCTFRSEAIKSDLELVLLTTPATQGERMKIITEASGGFVYLIAEWGADGVIIGSAIVRQLGEAASPKQGLKRLEEYARSIKDALP